MDSSEHILARLLKESRRASGLSQMELAMRLGVSQRHVSFIEIARTRPGRELLLDWMREVDAPAALRNAALLQAGYAVWRDAADEVEDATRTPPPLLGPLLAAHDPFPGLVFDADWRIVSANRGALWVEQLAMPDFRRRTDEAGGDMLLSLTHPSGMFSRLREPRPAAAALLGQLRAEQWVRPSLRARVDRLERSLTDRFGPLAGTPAGAPSSANLHLEFDTVVGRLAFFTLQTVLGLPQNVTPASLRLELWYPADPGTEGRLREAMAA